jgi:hypothetical protein
MEKTTRRQAIRSLVGGSALLPGILSELLADGQGADSLAARAPHFPARARRMIFLYMTGGVSHLDTFDPKPRLFADHGKNVPPQPGHGKKGGVLRRPLWEFKPRGACGTEVSDLFPCLSERVDDLCVIRSMKTGHDNHPEATLGMHTGSFALPRPSLGAWVSYGLGTVNRNLPSFVVIAPSLPWGGGWTWGADFLPGSHQGTRVFPGSQPVANLRRDGGTAGLQDLELGLLEAFNRDHLNLRDGDARLAARIQSFETAFGMQVEAPEAFDLSRESDATLALYGLERGSVKGFGWQCLVARRLAERGVRFIELIDTGAGATTGFVNWDAHQDMAGHAQMARNVDRPIAALLSDLKVRGMLEETLVVWATEFGRTATADGAEGKGRAHHPHAFTTWLAGGGVRPGIVHGKTDEYGMQVVEDEVHVHDFHATILHLLGLDHTRLTWRHAGRDFRLTDVHGNVVRKILA